MNSLYFRRDSLLSGQVAPFTGAAIQTVESKNLLFTVYSSGVGTVTLQYKAPFDIGGISPWNDFYTFSGLTTGYAAPLSISYPFEQIRAISAGNGVFHAGVFQRN